MNHSSRWLLVGGLVVGISTAALAFGPGAPLGSGAGPIGALPRPAAVLARLAHDLELTTEQRLEIRTILTSYRDEVAAEVAAIRSARELQFEAIHADSHDEALVRAAAAGVAAAEAELAVTRSVVVHEVAAVLTAEQREELQEKLTTLRAVVGDVIESMVGGLAGA